MNCTSYIPPHYPLTDLNMCESGFASPPFIFDGNNGEQGNVISSLPLDMDQHFSYDMALLSQMMQKHEATFRYQLQELHRLYRRQREIMDEIKMRKMFTPHRQLPNSQSINCLSQALSEVSQTSHTSSWILGDRSESRLSVLRTDNLRGPSDFVAENFQGPTTTRPGQLLARTCYNEVKTPLFIGKGHEMRTMNLRLPADVCQDAKEMERFDELTVSKVSKGDSELDLLKLGDSSSFDVRCQNKKILIDLNEPIQLESVASSSTGPSEPYTCYLEFSHHYPHVSGEVETESVVPNDCRHVRYDGDSVDRSSSVGIDLNAMPLSSSSETAITQEGLLNSNWESKAEDPKEHLFSSSAKSDYSSGVLCSSKNEISQASGVDKAVILNTISVHYHAMSKENCVKVDPDTRIGEKFLEFGTQIDLNIGVTADETFPSLSSNNVGTRSADETNLEAPVSPENKEGFPPRENSEDMLLRTPSLMSERGESEPENELDGIAAETLLLISSAKMQDFNFSNCLYWFAELASSTGNTHDEENKVMKLQNGTTNKHGGKLSQKKAVDLSLIVNKEKERVTLFCRSVKQHETKDHHTVKSFQRSCSRKRNAGRNLSEKPRNRSKYCPLDVKKPMSSIVKEPATRSKGGILQSWGKIKKRQGGPRRRASKFLIIS